MTTITFYKSNGIYYGFEEQGHTGYGESGDDVLCSALSAMTMLIINTIEVAYASNVEYIIDDKTTDIKVIAKGALSKFEKDDKKRFAVSGLIMAYSSIILFSSLKLHLGIFSEGLSPGQESLTASLKVAGLSSIKLRAHFPFLRIFCAVFDEFLQQRSIA